MGEVSNFSEKKFEIFYKGTKETLSHSITYTVYDKKENTTDTTGYIVDYAGPFRKNTFDLMLEGGFAYRLTHRSKLLTKTSKLFKHNSQKVLL